MPASHALLQLCIGMAALGALAALLAGSFAGRIGKALGLLDWPDQDGGRKQHVRVTPLVGGLPLALVAVIACLLASAAGSGLAGLAPVPELAGATTSANLGWLALAVGVMYLIGVSDDRFHLSPLLRLAAALVVLGLVIFQASDFFIGYLYFGGWSRLWLIGGGVGGVFTLLCLLGLLNAVNMADGKDGVVIGLGLIWAGVLAAHLPKALWPVMAAVVACLAVLLVFNMQRRLFLGDGGSYALSALFGLVAILSYNQGFESWHADDVAVLFAVPVFDTVRLMVVRKVRGRSPFEGDRDHLHHHLHARLGWPRGLGVYLVMVGVPNFAALALPGTGFVWLGASLAIYAGVLLATGFASTASASAAE